MPIKKPYTIRALDSKEVPHIDENFNRLFAHKLEARYKWEGSSTAAQAYIHNYVEYGQVTVSANGSAIVSKSIPLQERAERVLYVNAVAISNAVRAHVVSIDGSSIGIDVMAISGSGQALSAITTDTITLYYEIVGSNQGS